GSLQGGQVVKVSFESEIEASAVGQNLVNVAVGEGQRPDGKPIEGSDQKEVAILSSSTIPNDRLPEFETTELSHDNKITTCNQQDRENNLPKTGDKDNRKYIIIGFLLLMISLYYLYSRLILKKE
ncbi:LPXTG cell wall anchor domain-containing protein, partial [Vagococcus bubulae]